MIQVIKPQIWAKPEFGDVLYGGTYLSRLELHTIELFKIDGEGSNRLVQVESPATGFNGFREIGVDATALTDQVKYPCPWSENHYHWMYPLGVVTIDEKKYGRDRDDIKGCPWLCRVINQETDMDNIDPMETPLITNAMMGHGFTPGTLPSDGSGQKSLATIPLDNGDELLVACWVWSNR